MASTAEKSKVLVIGGTGYIGKFITEASARSGHRTFALVRDTAPSDPSKSQLFQKFNDLGVTLIQGDLYNHESLVKAISAVDVVISAVGYAQLPDQTNIIAAIKEAGNIKRFLPSEYGNDVDRVHAVEPGKSMFAKKAQFRRVVEAEGIPYTFVSSNFFAGRFLPTLGQVGVSGPPTDKVVILGDGNTKAVFVTEEDIATYTIKAIDDPRTLNKILYMRPPENTLSPNELVSLWEKKIGKKLERVYVPEEEVLKRIQGRLFNYLTIFRKLYVITSCINFQILGLFVETRSITYAIQIIRKIRHIQVHMTYKLSYLPICLQLVF
ncbi:Isoflavone reductase-like protein [Rhynchospora pubera]|uniref:Isoflavone reductase-like protein n=1 Tax=Rhynchospora pubera TaxID=906938 RepID=A0AAV8H029_9POAL|nr:Isoflavone reductase-like protein [Rhynchospora pubera]